MAGQARQGLAGQARRGWARHDWVWHGKARQAIDFNHENLR